MKPFMVQVLKAYNSPIPPDQVIYIMSILGNVTNILFILLIRFTGKRKLYLFCLCGVFVASATVSSFGLIYIPSGFVSFDQANNESFQLENKSLYYIPVVGLVMWTFFTDLGVAHIAWMLLSEIFPFK